MPTTPPNTTPPEDAPVASTPEGASERSPRSGAASEAPPTDHVAADPTSGPTGSGTAASPGIGEPEAHGEDGGEPGADPTDERESPPGGTNGDAGPSSNGGSAKAGFLISFEEIMREDVPPIEWEVEPLIARGDRVVLFGAFGSFKSWLLLHLAMHLAAGRDWLDDFAIPRPRRVLYIDEEMNQRTLRRRVKRLGVGAGFDGHDLQLEYMSRKGVHLDEQGAHRLLAVLGRCAFDPDVIIVETLRRVLIGHENDAQDLGRFWRAVEPILRAGKTLIISHHMKKPQAEGGGATRDQASGSTDILAGADTGFGVKLAQRDHILVECVKSREAEIEKPFGVHLHAPGEDGPAELRREEAALLQEKMRHAVDVILGFLTTAPNQMARTAEIHADLEAHGIAKRTRERALAEAKKAGKVSQVHQGLWKLGGGEPAKG